MIFEKDGYKIEYKTSLTIKEKEEYFRNGGADNIYKLLLDSVSDTQIKEAMESGAAPALILSRYLDEVKILKKRIAVVKAYSTKLEKDSKEISVDEFLDTTDESLVADVANTILDEKEKAEEIKKNTSDSSGEL